MSVRNLTWTAIGLLAVAAACSAPVSRLALHPSSRSVALPPSVRVQFVKNGRTVVEPVALERYVEATILSEFAPAAGDVSSVERMYEVQAVISRTYAAASLGRHGAEGFDLCSTTHCQLYQPGRLETSRWAAAAAEAVRRTGSLVLSYQGTPASALFHADCGGRTSSDAEVWGGLAHPYLASVNDDGPASGAHATWRFETTVAAAASALDADPRTRVEGPFEALDIVERDGAGRAERVAVRGREPRIVRGEELRQVLSRAFGDRAIRSTRFDVRRDRNRLVFEGRGFGHGVGLCQTGALARIRAGADPAAVLSVYYPGTDLLAARFSVPPR